MGFFSKKNIGVVPKGDLESDSVIEAIYELDEDLKSLSNQVASVTQGNTVVQATEPTVKEGLWVDTSV